MLDAPARHVKTLRLDLDIVHGKCGTRIAFTRQVNEGSYSVNDRTRTRPGEKSVGGVGDFKVSAPHVGDPYSVERAMALKYHFCCRHCDQSDIRLSRRKLEAALKRGDRILEI